MTLTKKINGDTMIIEVEGRLDTTCAPSFGREVEKCVTETTKLVFDFDRLQYIASSGLRMLLLAQKEMNKRGEMSIINVHEQIYEVLEATGFTGVCDISVAG